MTDAGGGFSAGGGVPRQGSQTLTAFAGPDSVMNRVAGDQAIQRGQCTTPTAACAQQNSDYGQARAARQNEQALQPIMTDMDAALMFTPMGIVSSAARAALGARGATAYSVAFETTIAKAGVGTRASHFTDANKTLAQAMNKDPGVAKMMDSLGVKVTQRLDQSPAAWTWHHVPNQPGTLQLVPRSQHQGGPWQSVLHPNQTGGFKLWGIDYEEISMNLGALIDRLPNMDDTLCLFAAKPWSVASAAMAAPLDVALRPPREIVEQGLAYFLEVHVAREALEVFGDRPPTQDEQRKLLIFYAENDAFPEWVYTR